MYGDWTLTYEGVEYRFGPPGQPVELVRWEFATDSYRVDDTATPRGDGTHFGQDFIEPGELKISVKIDFTDAPYPAIECARRAWEARSALATAWRADWVRAIPSRTATLIMGDTQAVEGRPRRIRFDDSRQNVGLIYADLFFVLADPSIYVLTEDGSAVWRQHTVSLAPAESGFLSEPLTEPLTAAVASSNTGAFTVGGTAAAWPIITVQGPLSTGGRFELVSVWTARLNRALKYDDEAIFDTRPGQRLMTLNGAPVNLLAASSVRLSDMFIEPGPQALALRGASVEGTATATVRWRDTRGA